MNCDRPAAALAGAAAILLLLCARPAFAGNDSNPAVATCLAASNASLELADANHLRAARAKLVLCARDECPADVRRECVRRVEEVNASLPTIVFDVKDATGRDVTAVRVTMDGESLADRIDGTALAVDPGEHTFTFEGGRVSVVSKKLLVREGQKDRHESVVLAAPPVPTAKLSAESATPPASAGAAGSDAAEHGGARLDSRRMASIAALSLGAIGLAIGMGSGLDALSKRAAAERSCPALCPDQSGVDAWGRAKSAASLSTVGFLVGGAAAAAGVVLWLTAPPAQSGDSRPRVGLGLDGVRLAGTW